MLAAKVLYEREKESPVPFDTETRTKPVCVMAANIVAELYSKWNFISEEDIQALTQAYDYSLFLEAFETPGHIFVTIITGLLNQRLARDELHFIRVAVWHGFYDAFHKDLQKKLAEVKEVIAKKLAEENEVIADIAGIERYEDESGELFWAFWKSANAVFVRHNSNGSYDLLDDEKLSPE